MPHFCTIPIVVKEIICQNHQPRKRDNFDCFFKRVNSTIAASPPLIVGDSRSFAAEPKARWPLDLILPPTHKKHKKGSLPDMDPRKSELLLGYLGLRTISYHQSCPDLLLLSTVESQSWDQLPLLLPCGSASGAVT
jgi:hypothetical protein